MENKHNEKWSKNGTVFGPNKVGIVFYGIPELTKETIVQGLD